jgi:hypothetical protein
MEYDEIEKGMEVRIEVPTPKFCTNGTVKAKEISTVGGKEVERVYVDTAERGRRICAPSVLRLIS